MQFIPSAQALKRGIVGSLVGTVVFGMVMTMMGMMPMIAQLVGSSNVGVGWLVHLVIGTLFGLPLAWLLDHLPHVSRLLLGVGYGVAVWVFGPLVVMPLWLGMPGMVFNLASETVWFSLMGHLVYGFLAGLTVWFLERRHAPRPVPRTAPAAR
jgi:hypothetical protein